jgi:hypothetical protein
MQPSAFFSLGLSLIRGENRALGLLGLNFGVFGE